MRQSRDDQRIVTQRGIPQGIRREAGSQTWLLALKVQVRRCGQKAEDFRELFSGFSPVLLRHNSDLVSDAIERRGFKGEINV